MWEGFCVQYKKVGEGRVLLIGGMEVFLCMVLHVCRQEENFDYSIAPEH